MHKRNISLPEDLQLIDLSKLNYVDGWAYAATTFLTNSATVYFVSSGDNEFDLSCFKGKEIKIRPYTCFRVSTKYAKTHEEIFKSGIKETAKKLADDGYYEMALKVIPTSLCVFDKSFMDIFGIHYEMSLRHSKLSEERKKHLRKLRYDTMENQIDILNKYHDIKVSQIKSNKMSIDELRPKVLN